MARTAWNRSRRPTYCAAKHAQSVTHRTLRGELLGQPVRLTEVLPGLVETEFSVVRFGGDEEKAAATRVHRAPRTSAAGTTG